MSAIGNLYHTQEYLYDFAADGGLQSTIVLSDKAGMPNVPVGATVKRAYARVLTQLTSGGAATLSWGNGDDADGYSGATAAVAGFTADAVFNGIDNAAALIWDDTNDHQIDLAVTDAGSGQVSFTITDADLTAGKLAIVVEFYVPGQAEAS